MGNYTLYISVSYFVTSLLLILNIGFMLSERRKIKKMLKSIAGNL